ncbi:MAG: tRNA (guanine-N(7)-)-methyltransferase [Spirochaetia bacterium]|nr:tRNA (guanine-N(7)-)-methyltransferase [Spirochaetia bacterium]
MTIKNRETITEKLFRIAAVKRGYKLHKSIVVPEKLTPLTKDLLISRPEGFTVLELGAGSGEFAAEWVKKHPEHNYIAFEIKGHRIKSLLGEIDRFGLNSIKIIPVNFKWFLNEILPGHFADLVIINFPDPWPKKRHWKHRLIDQEFPIKISEIVKEGGIVHIATDYGPYARKVLSVFRNSEMFIPEYDFPHYKRTKPDDFPSTRFEKIHENDGKKSYYQQWRLIHGRKKSDIQKPDQGIDPSK